MYHDRSKTLLKKELKKKKISTFSDSGVEAGALGKMNPDSRAGREYSGINMDKFSIKQRSINQSIKFIHCKKHEKNRYNKYSKITKKNKM